MSWSYDHSPGLFLSPQTGGVGSFDIAGLLNNPSFMSMVTCAPASPGAWPRACVHLCTPALGQGCPRWGGDRGAMGGAASQPHPLGAGSSPRVAATDGPGQHPMSQGAAPPPNETPT